MKVKIIPKCRRAKNRINEHGDIMHVVQKGVHEGIPAILVESLEKTWGGDDYKQVWIGWITTKEADWKEV